MWVTDQKEGRDGTEEDKAGWHASPLSLSLSLLATEVASDTDNQLTDERTLHRSRRILDELQLEVGVNVYAPIAHGTCCVL